MRPYYETAGDLRKEDAVMGLFCERFGVQAAKLKPSLVVDYALMRKDRMVGVAEVKVRHKSYPELFLSLHKVHAMRQHVMDGGRARVVFATPDGVFVQKVEFADNDPTIRYAMGLGGCTDRGDKDDVEPVVFFPMAGMERIADAKQEWFR